VLQAAKLMLVTGFEFRVWSVSGIICRNKTQNKCCMQKFQNQVVVSYLLFSSLPAGAALYDRGGGLIYDDVLDVTWMQDAAYQVTTNAPNADASGRMTWQDAVDWVDSIVYYDSVRNVNWTDWRLPKMLPVNGLAFDINNSYDGSTDNGWNITSPASELSYMYHVNLGNLSLFDTEGNFGQEGFGLKNTGPFNGLSAGATWTMTSHPSQSAEGFVLGMGNGHQEFFTKDTALYVWAVRDGDVATIPDGDLNDDGQVDGVDVLIGFRLLAGDITATPQQFQRADVAPVVGGEPSPDGQVGIGDVLLIQRKALGLASFP
jgi:hypothetical protein